MPHALAGLILGAVVLSVMSWVAGLVVPLLIGLGGAPGAFLARARGWQTVGLLLCVAGQLVVVIPYAAVVASFTLSFVRQVGWWGWILWPVGFWTTQAPLTDCASAVMRDEREDPESNQGRSLTQARAVFWTAGLGLSAYVAFAILMAIFTR